MHFYPCCMKNNRSRNDIVSAILEAVNQDGSSKVPKTRIMYRAFLSYAQLNQYMDLVEENGLIEYEESERGYSLTEKGMHVLKMCNQLDQMATLTRTS
jgi:predicted transcriptional regulator